MVKCIFLLFCFFCINVFPDEWDGDIYSKNSSVQLSKSRSLIDNLHLNGDEEILDIGCGDGKISALLAKKVPFGSVVGIDPSLSMLSKAYSIKINNLSFDKQSAEHFSLDQKFDHIVSFYALHWVKDQKTALKNIYNHLKPKGTAHFILAQSKDDLPFGRALNKTKANLKDEFNNFTNSIYYFDTETYRKLLCEAGFHINTISYVNDKTMHKNKESLSSWIQQWLPEGKHLPLSKKNDFFSILMSYYFDEVKIPSSSKDPIEYGEYVMIVEASKI